MVYEIFKILFSNNIVAKLMIRTIFLLSAVFLITSCSHSLSPVFPKRISSLSGSDFYKKASGMNWISRDSLVVNEVLKGNIPDFLKKFVPVQISGIVNDKTVEACIFVAPDYLSVGSDDDWARVCITPMAAQKIADSLHCFLPTRKIVDQIFNASKVKLEPVPMFAYRDSTPTMWHHHLIIEGQRKRSKGLISGIKKDVVISDKILSYSALDRVVIYGWHFPDGRPIQPLYAGHANWYVDYSHGVRLIYEKILIEGKLLHYTAVLKHPVYKKLICDEEDCIFYRYNY
jgi:hypothetical protein